MPDELSEYQKTCAEACEWCRMYGPPDFRGRGHLVDDVVEDCIAAAKIPLESFAQSQALARQAAERERLLIQRAICKTQCGGDGSEDDDVRYTTEEITEHIARMDEQREESSHLKVVAERELAALTEERDRLARELEAARQALGDLVNCVERGPLCPHKELEAVFRCARAALAPATHVVRRDDGSEPFRGSESECRDWVSAHSGEYRIAALVPAPPQPAKEVSGIPVWPAEKAEETE